MEKSFPVILGELRKERGLSQKEAAASLGISQALLSHYEKGIRECGHSFLIKVADFYGVTCDYLLGRSSDRSGDGELSLLSDSLEDEKSNSRTIYKASMLLRDILASNGVETGFDFEHLMMLEVYRIIILEAGAGRLPKNWAGRACSDGEVCCNPLFLDVIAKTLDRYVQPQKAKRPAEDSAVPKAIETLVKNAEELVLEHFAQNIPPIPFEYVK